MLSTAYTIDERIYVGVRTVVYRAHRVSDGRAVVIKSPREEYPGRTMVAQYRDEYDIMRMIAHDAVSSVLSIDNDDGRPLLVFDDIGATALGEIVKGRPLDLYEFLPLAIRIADALAAIHATGVMHKDVNPRNIIVTQGCRVVQIIDFGSASRLALESPGLIAGGMLEGTLPYISPEQTGRMNRLLDHRTDLYSVGVTFYELLTGMLPFPVGDIMEMVHAHIAVKPQSPAERDRAVPRMVSDIVMHLLEKTAEARYQSAAGLRSDLEECLHRLRDHGTIDPFPIGEHDISGALRIPQKLYGRDTEREALLGGFERAAAGLAEAMFIDGLSGIGKSALVHEVHRPIVALHGYFVEGKFDPLQRNVAYSGLLNALRELVRMLLAERAEHLELWKERLMQAFGANGRLIIELMPEVELIVGPQPPLSDLGAAEGQRRFDRVFTAFVRTFAHSEHPLVIFLDDLQWADAGTLKFLAGLMSDPETHYLYLIGAYRSNEIPAGHPLLSLLETLRTTAVPMQAITLSPLGVQHITALLFDTLRCTIERATELAAVVHRKTAGNPFFLNQFLMSLADLGVLRFDAVLRKWAWDVSAVEQAAITENVVDLMALKIRRLPEEAQEALKFAACIGNTFDVQTLAIVMQRTESETTAAILDAAREQLIVGAHGAAGRYRFLHDRVQEAAYALMEEVPRAALHHTIGTLLLQSIPLEQRDERIFDIVTHLNRGLDLITSDEERASVARLNFTAGRRAKASGAFDAASHYFDVAMRFLPPSPWETEYEFTIALVSESIAAAFLSSNDELMNRLADDLIAHARTPLEKLPVYEVRIQYCLAHNLLSEVLDQVADILHQLGVKFPRHQSQFGQVLTVLRCRLVVGFRKPRHFEQLPVMTDTRMLAINRLIASSTVAIYLGNPGLVPAMILHLLRITLKGGSSPYAAHAFNGYALFLTAFLSDIPGGYAFGKMSLTILDTFHAEEMKAAVLSSYYGLTSHWREHIRSTILPLKEAVESGVQTGDLKNAALASDVVSYHYLWVGEELEQAERIIGEYCAQMEKLRQDRVLGGLRQYQQVCLNLMGRAADPTKMDGAHYHEAIHFAEIEAAHDYSSIAAFHTFKGMLLYLFGEPMNACEHLAIAGKHMMDALPGTTFVAVHAFYDSLAQLAVCTSMKGAAKRKALKRVAKNQGKMRTWAKFAPMNYAHKFALVEGERRRVEGKTTEAIVCFDEAIEGARQNGFVQDEALANELAARMCHAAGKIHIARFHAREAHFAYTRWGATAKAQELEQWMLDLAPSAPSGDALAGTQTLLTQVPATLSTGMAALDTATVLKASQALSREIVLSTLLEKLVLIACENAGAERGVLVLERDGRWYIEANRGIDGAAVGTDLSLPVTGSGLVPEAVLQYVARTKEVIVLGNASQEGRFVRDPYIVAHGSKSLLCAPMLTQGKLVGMIVLENNLISNAFPADRVEVITLLSSQAAISIENARLYANLQSQTESLARTNTAYSRFVPREFLSLLNKGDITDVALGDQVQKEMTVLFSDIWSFTTMSENMSPKENFDFLNSILRIVGPAIRMHRGFIDKYIGDAIMALFPMSPANAIDAAIEMRRALDAYNATQSVPVTMGIGIHTGTLMLGTIGEMERMEGTVISDAVNLASRIEGLTRRYGAGILISEDTLRKVGDAARYSWRRVDRVRVHGKQDVVTVIEILEGDSPARRDRKRETLEQFEQGLQHYYGRAFVDASSVFTSLAKRDPEDNLFQLYLERARYAHTSGVAGDWDGAETLTTK